MRASLASGTLPAWLPSAPDMRKTTPHDPDVSLFTDDEVRDYRVHLTTVKGYKAATQSHSILGTRRLETAATSAKTSASSVEPSASAD